VKVPTNVASASLHPDKHVFVCGGEDFKMYKFDYITGNEIGKGTVLYVLDVIMIPNCLFPHRILQGSLWTRAQREI